MVANSYDYSVFGLHIRSALRLPELFEAPTGSTPEVKIRLGHVPDPPARGGGLHETVGGLLLVIDGVGRYFIKGGTEIIVEPAPSSAPADVRVYLLGSAMGALLHQCGLLPLHANAIEINGRAFAFLGHSGAGKSTLAAWFHDRGYRIVADDVCVVRFDPRGRAVASPGLPRLRLWKESLQASGREPSLFKRSFAGDDSREKYDVPIARSAAAVAEIGLAGVYLLQKGSTFAITRLQGVDASEALMSNTYRGSYVATVRGQQVHWAACVRLAQNTPVFLAERRWGLEKFDEQCGRLLNHALEIAGQ